MKLPTIPSEGFLRALPAAERKKLGKAGLTQAEAREAEVARNEKLLQREIAQYLDLNRIYYESDRMDKRTSGRKGRADFRCCINGLWLSIEAKIAKSKLRPEQVKEAEKLINSGGRFVIVRSLEAAIKHLARLRAISGELYKYDSFDYRLDLR